MSNCVVKMKQSLIDKSYITYPREQKLIKSCMSVYYHQFHTYDHKKTLCQQGSEKQVQLRMKNWLYKNSFSFFNGHETK